METGQRTNNRIYLLDPLETFQIQLNLDVGKFNI